ncbi:AraC family transcriptional regulator [Brevibacillus migulae]|uniref:AraC family transcriptional regulator n=1 Tax=Brevibacillus migulae TaxID=1644114 RepID=UPI00106DF20F|nr:AraC family transcriptional regulator [Brevibacillus migulae]
MTDVQGFAISMVYPIRKTIVHKGLDFEDFCRQVSFDSSLLQDVEARIEEKELIRLMNEAAAFTQDDHFGLHQGQLTDIADMGILGYVMMHSEKIVDALLAFQRYNVILCNGYNVEWEERGSDMVLRFVKTTPEQISRHCMEDMVSSLYHLIVRMSNRAIPILEMQFTHAAPSDVVPYREVFGTVPRFSGKENTLRLSKEVFQYPILYSDYRLRTAFEPIAEEIKRKLMQGRVFSNQVFQWMMSRMPAFLPTLQETAKAFQMSPRTLQAKLKEEHTSYNELAASVRKEIAIGYIKKGCSIGEIAYLLHYSEPSAFQNAFKKWTGVTPGQFRAKIEAM